MIDCIVFEDDPEGLSTNKCDHWDDLGIDRPSIVLQATAWLAGKNVSSLCDIDFFATDTDWIRGAFTRVSHIPERCPHLRSLAKNMGLP